jgi:hypothetical protein
MSKKNKDKDKDIEPVEPYAVEPYALGAGAIELPPGVLPDEEPEPVEELDLAPPPDISSEDLLPAVEEPTVELLDPNIQTPYPSKLFIWTDADFGAYHRDGVPSSWRTPRPKPLSC